MLSASRSSGGCSSPGVLPGIHGHAANLKAPERLPSASSNLKQTLRAGKAGDSLVYSPFSSVSIKYVHKCHQVISRDVSNNAGQVVRFHLDAHGFPVVMRGRKPNVFSPEYWISGVLCIKFLRDVVAS